MSVQLGNYWFFAIFIPIIVIGFIILYLLKGEKYKYFRFTIFCIVLLIGHILLPFFDVGIFPNLIYNILFYALLLMGGLCFTYFYILKIEEKSLQEIGWKSLNIFKDIGIGLIFGIILLLFAAIIMLPFQELALEELSFSIEKVITVIFFALGAIYEECFFRGVLQKELEDKFDEIKAIIIQAIVFLSINLFYFPFDLLGVVNYSVMFVLALLVGFLAYKYSLFCSATAHVFFVLLAGLLV